ncbi:MAG: 5'/3'-nucleotidase SurE [Verrucomicrobiota bacterium]|nr:5'/3'-nucleotidase SurE [Verrucomicrobiota bacterium]
MPTALLTNDDGVNCGFFRLLVEACARHFDVVIAVPAYEQSWGGRSLSRHKTVTATPLSGFPGRGWKIDGTPTDCVNIALGNLLPALPDIVISGINVGYNTTLPLLYCSGTVSAALEGSIWGLHAVAASQMLTDPLFEAIKEAQNTIPASLQPHLQYAADFTAEYALKLLATPVTRYRVHNLNFPTNSAPTTPVARTIPADLRLGSLFQPVESKPALPPSLDGEQAFAFKFRHGKALPSPQLTDRDALLAGRISISELDFSRL